MKSITKHFPKYGKIKFSGKDRGDVGIEAVVWRFSVLKLQASRSYWRIRIPTSQNICDRMLLVNQWTLGPVHNSFLSSWKRVEFLATQEFVSTSSPPVTQLRKVSKLSVRFNLFNQFWLNVPFLQPLIPLYRIRGRYTIISFFHVNFEKMSDVVRLFLLLTRQKYVSGEYEAVLNFNVFWLVTK